MKKKIKKAFTLVELLVVIAILAILATVSIVGYNSFTKKAKVSNDMVLVKQMNDVLFANSQVDGNNATMTDALNDVLDGGYDIEKLTPTTTNYNIVWDSINDQMVLLDESKKAVYPENVTTATKDMYLITKSSDDFTSTSSDFAHYLTSDFTYVNGSLEIKTGLDVGKNSTVKDITYTGDTNAKTVTIRTNGGNLTINGEKDVVNHYGAANYTNIVKVANESYHEFGVSAFVRIESGHFVAESTAKVINLNVANSAAIITTNTGSNVSAFSKANADVTVSVNGSTKEVSDLKTENDLKELVENNSVVAKAELLK